MYLVYAWHPCAGTAHGVWCEPDAGCENGVIRGGRRRPEGRAPRRGGGATAARVGHFPKDVSPGGAAGRRRGAWPGARMCTHMHSRGGFTASSRGARKSRWLACRRVVRCVARMARCLCALARALRVHARPRQRVLAGHPKRVRVQLRVAHVQCDLCKACAHVQSWQQSGMAGGVPCARVLGEAQNMSIIPHARA